MATLQKWLATKQWNHGPGNKEQLVLKYDCWAGKAGDVVAELAIDEKLATRCEGLDLLPPDGSTRNLGVLRGRVVQVVNDYCGQPVGLVELAGIPEAMNEH